MLYIPYVLPTSKNVVYWSLLRGLVFLDIPYELQSKLLVRRTKVMVGKVRQQKPARIVTQSKLLVSPLVDLEQ